MHRSCILSCICLSSCLPAISYLRGLKLKVLLLLVASHLLKVQGRRGDGVEKEERILLHQPHALGLADCNSFAHLIRFDHAGSSGDDRNLASSLSLLVRSIHHHTVTVNARFKL